VDGTRLQPEVNRTEREFCAPWEGAIYREHIQPPTMVKLQQEYRKSQRTFTKTLWYGRFRNSAAPKTSTDLVGRSWGLAGDRSGRRRRRNVRRRCNRSHAEWM